MAPEATSAKQTMTVHLPMMVVGPVDVGRLLRELDNINETLLQLGLRNSGEAVKMPKTTKMMEQLVELNKLNLLQEADRKQLQSMLMAVKDKAPIIHISFSADPAPAFVEKLMSWLRKEIHPLLLITIGLQPNIGAGCIVRTANKQFDLSLRQDFLNKRDLLATKLSTVEQTA